MKEKHKNEGAATAAPSGWVFSFYRWRQQNRPLVPVALTDQPALVIVIVGNGVVIAVADSGQVIVPGVSIAVACQGVRTRLDGAAQTEIAVGKDIGSGASKQRTVPCLKNE